MPSANGQVLSPLLLAASSSWQLRPIYLYVVDSWTISRKHLVGAQTLAHSGNHLRDCGAFANTFSISVAGGGPCAARAYCLRELCKRP